MARLKNPNAEQIAATAASEIAQIVDNAEEAILNPKQIVKQHKENKRQGNPALVKGGASINPNWKNDMMKGGGRPKGAISIAALIHKAFIDNPAKAQAVANKLISLAMGGDMDAMRELLNRVDGKVAEVHKLDSENPVTLIFTPAISQTNNNLTLAGAEPTKGIVIETAHEIVEESLPLLG